MKYLKSTVILCLLVASGNLFAQEDTTDFSSATSQGKWVLGGSSSLNFTTQTPKFKTDSGGTQEGESRTSSFSFSPSAGYFVVDNLALGVGLSVDSSKLKFDNFDFEERTNTIVFQPFVRYYFSQGNIKPFLQGTVGLGTSKFNEEGNFEDFEVKSSVFSYGFDGGVAFFINNSISIDLGVGYASVSAKPSEDNPDNFRSISSGFGFNAGFSIFL